MFGKKLIDKTLKDYKQYGILPDLWSSDAKMVDDFEKMAFILLLEKSIDFDKKAIKEKLEKDITSNGKSTEYLKITYKEASLRASVTEEGKKFLEENHSIYLKETRVKSSFIWTLR